MKKSINCSFDELGVVMTAWNGVHPDKPGHFSKTITMNRADFVEACADRRKFGEVLGIDISAGWQNPIKDVINGTKGLKVDMRAMTDFLVQMLAQHHGADAEKVFAELEAQNGKIEEVVMKHCEEMQAKQDAEKAPEQDADDKKEEGNDNSGKKTGTRKGNKKSGGTDNSGTPDETGGSDVA